MEMTRIVAGSCCLFLTVSGKAARHWWIVLCLLAFIESSAQKAKKIYRQLNGAVVKIIVLKNGKPLAGNGSGVIIKSRGWVITNYHVIDRKGDGLMALHEGRHIKTDSIIAYDKAKDILILALSADNDPALVRSIPNVKIRRTPGLKVGERIYAIGSPYGLDNTITEGLISGLRASNDSMQHLIQVSAAISPGSSGGAVVDKKGRLIGISTMFLGGKGAQNLNFAVTAGDVIAISEGKKAPLGKSKATAAGYYMDQGSADYAQKRYRQSLENYHRARAVTLDRREQAKVLHNIGLCWEQLDHRDSAVFYYEAALRYHATAQTHRALAMCLNNQGDYLGAITHLRRVLAFSPRDYDAHFMLAGAYTFAGDPGSAKPLLQKVLKMKPGYAPAYHLAGRVHAAAGEYDSAITFYKQAIQLQPDYLEPYREIIEACAAKGDLAGAEEWTEKLRMAAR